MGNLRKALLIGIDDYECPENNLNGCVKDVNRLIPLLSRHENGEVNFSVQKIISSKKEFITKEMIEKSIEFLFDDNRGDIEISLLYFSGHGGIKNDKSVIVDSYGEEIDTAWISEKASKCDSINKVIILDCCNAGAISLGKSEENNSQFYDYAKVGTNITIIASSRENQPSYDGFFTNLLCAALSGEASNILGEITPAGIYHFVDKIIGANGPRPVFITHSSKFICLRKTNPSLSRKTLLKLVEYFETSDFEFKLDPCFEPKPAEVDIKGVHWEKNSDKNRIFADLQLFCQSGLVTPVDEKHMYDAAMHSKSCKLTLLGRCYFSFISEGAI